MREIALPLNALASAMEKEDEGQEEGSSKEEVEPTIEKADDVEKVDSTEKKIDAKDPTFFSLCAVDIVYSELNCYRYRVRSFPLSLPEELQERGLPEQRWRKIIKKVNRIWDPPVEICSNYSIGLCCPGVCIENVCGEDDIKSKAGAM